MTTFFSYFVVVVSLYLICIVVIGILGLRKTHTEDDFLTASRSIGPWVGGAVLAATQISAGTLVGTVGRHYATGVSWVRIGPRNGTSAEAEPASGASPMMEAK